MAKGLRALLGYLLVASLPVAAGLFRVRVHQDVVELGYQLSVEQSRKRELSEELRQLEVELAAERSPARLRKLARRLGLVPPQPDQIVAKQSAAAMPSTVHRGEGIDGQP